ncbi:MAG: RidA family protein [Candidatus Promineifilaceae bacterium]
MTRLNISSGSPWEDIVGYCRAVRIGDVVEVAGTVASDENGNVVGKGDAALQAHFIFTKIEKALKKAGASMSDVVRTRMFVTDISQFEAIGRTHGKFFRDVRPVATMVEVTALVSPDYLIEIEVTARLGG